MSWEISLITVEIQSFKTKNKGFHSVLSFNDFNQSYFLIILKHHPNSVNIQIILMAAFSQM